MSSSATSESLSKAYRLIEADELGAARAILEPVLEAEPENADAWWLYAHAVSDISDARRALDNVLRLNPHYPGAVELSNQLEAISRSEAETEPLPVAEPEPPEPVAVEEPVVAEPVAEDLPDLDDELENSGRSLPALRLLAVVAAIVIVLVIVALLALQNAGGNTEPGVSVVPSPSPEVGIGALTEEAEPTAVETEPEAVLPAETEVVAATAETDAGILSVASTEAVASDDQVAEDAEAETAGIEPDQTEEPAAEVAVTETTPLGQEVALLPAEGDFTPLEDALAGFTLADEGVLRAETELGDTLLVSVCSTAGAEVRAALPQVMDVMASHAAVVAGDAEAVGARMVNCDSGRPLVIIAVEKEHAIAYAVGNLTAQEFQAQWRPQ